MPFSAKWFFLYYSVLGIMLILGGGYLVISYNEVQNWLLTTTDHKKPPVFLIRLLKYLVLFTLPGLVLAFFPFSLVELLFSIWSLILLYIAAMQLVRWKQNRQLIKEHQSTVAVLIRRSGSIMIAVGFAVLLLAYFVVK